MPWTALAAEDSSSSGQIYLRSHLIPRTSFHVFLNETKHPKKRPCDTLTGLPKFYSNNTMSDF